MGRDSFLFIFLFFYLLYWYSYIVYFVCAPASEFGARPNGGDSFLSIFLKTKKQKKMIVGRNQTQGFIHAPGISMGSKPWLAWADKTSRRPRAPGEKASADLKKFQQIFTLVQLASNLRDNRSRMSKLKYSLAPRSGTCVPNLSLTPPTPLHSRSQRSKHR